MVDSGGGYGCFASVRSLVEAPREREREPRNHLRAQNISEVSVIPETRGRIGKEKEERREQA
jgi:hypothetical protein